MSRRRIDPALLGVDPRVAQGFFSDVYFNRTREVLLAEGLHPVVRWQVFQKKDAILCGADEAIGTMKAALGDGWGRLAVWALEDGDAIAPWETVLLVEGDLALFAHMETIVLGILARRTRVATNAHRVVRAAALVSPKPVLFFPARHDLYLAQPGDGYAFHVAARRALGAAAGGVSTPAQASWWGGAALGTIPHSLEAAFGGDVVRATLAFAERVDPVVPRVALVDYHNDCVRTSLEVADAMLARFLATGDERFRLREVRLDTSETLVDRSLEGEAESPAVGGVSASLVRNVHRALRDRAISHPEGSVARGFFEGIGIIVSGGFTAEKIEAFEREGVPVTAYGVGSSLFLGQFDFTADVVGRLVDGAWRPEAKVGREYRPSPRLSRAE